MFVTIGKHRFNLLQITRVEQTGTDCTIYFSNDLDTLQLGEDAAKKFLNYWDNSEYTANLNQEHADSARQTAPARRTFDVGP